MRLIDLKKASAVSIHFVLPEEVNATGLASLGLEVMEGSVADVRTNLELFAVVATAMKFPDYFGNNWDALNDCLTDMEWWLPSGGYLLVLRNGAKGWSQSSYVLGRFVTSWLAAAEYWTENRIPFHLVFVM
ncbi:hypothetical protein JCM14076_22160 [Methylosoma difficile]